MVVCLFACLFVCLFPSIHSSLIASQFFPCRNLWPSEKSTFQLHAEKQHFPWRFNFLVSSGKGYSRSICIQRKYHTRTQSCSRCRTMLRCHVTGKFGAENVTSKTSRPPTRAVVAAKNTNAVLRGKCSVFKRIFFLFVFTMFSAVCQTFE